MTFTVGLPNYYSISKNELLYLIKNYGSKLDCWYTSPPFGEKFASRKNVDIQLTKENINIIKNQLLLLKDNNQNIELALNGIKLNNINSKNEIEFYYNKFNELFVEPDRIVSLNNLIPYLYNFEKPITYSYNNRSFDNNIIKQYCDRIVLGNKNLRNIKLFEFFHNENIQIELLLNNGCHNLCIRKCGQECLQQQYILIEKYGADYCLAEQSLLPCELKLYPEYIKLFKISSRPSDFNYLNQTLFYYSNLISINDLKKDIDLSNINSWFYFNRLGNLNDYFTKNRLIIDINKIIDIKNEIWSKILNRNIEIQNL